MKKFKFLQIGVGSMGKRRIRNLKYLGFDNIMCFDSRDDRLVEAKSKYNVDTVDSLKKIDWTDITHVIISTPPDCHHEYILEAIERDKHFFVEASVIDESYNKIIKKLDNKTITAAPSTTMNFDPIIVKAKEIINSGVLGKMLFLNHYFGQYLPNWHPYESIKDFYVSNPSTGGGREIVPFDIIYLVELFGFPIKISAMKRNTKRLGIDIDDIYSMILLTENNVQSSVTIDVLSRVSYRDTRIIFSDGNIEIDNVKGILKCFTSKDDKWEIYSRNSLSKTYSNEEMYVNEMESFINASCGNGDFPNNFKNDYKILKILQAAEKSSNCGKVVELNL